MSGLSNIEHFFTVKSAVKKTYSDFGVTSHKI